MQTRPYKAIFLDLDGTLLPMDLDKFLARYFEELGAFLYRRGVDPKPFIKGINEGMRAMTKEPDAGVLNEEKFWKVFSGRMEQPRDALEPYLMEFYGTDFNKVGDSCTLNPAAEQALATLDAKGYPLYLTTMPMFPPIGVEMRLKWAGCDPAHFDRMTTYDNSTATKPHLAFFKENLSVGGFAPEEVLMVGNNTVEDLDCMKLGMDAYLVTDFLIDPTDDFDFDAVKHGTLAEFAKFAATLPDRR